MQHKIIYLYDALCGWCYGFSPVMQQLYSKYAGRIEFEVLSGGMMRGPRMGPIDEVAPYIKKAYRDVEARTGVTFGVPFLENILEPGTAVLSSDMPGIALTVFRQHLPGQVLAFAHALQNALYRDGLELNDVETYRALAGQFGLPGDDFIRDLQAEENRYATMQEFQTVANWGISGFPTLLLKPANDTQYYMIARGYAPFEQVDAVIGTVVPELA